MYIHLLVVIVYFLPLTARAYEINEELDKTKDYGSTENYVLKRNKDPLHKITDEQKLMEFLLARYDTSGRPVYNASHTVTVKFGFTLTQISDVDEVNQILTTNVWIEQEWQDERLKWDPNDYNGLTVLRIPCSKIWLPDIVLYNSADDFTNGYMQSKAMVNATGNVFWSPPARFRSSCKIVITYFPFDDQVCDMKFGSWTYDGFQVDITNRSSEVDLQNYVFSGEWELLGVDIIRHETYYACCPEPFPDVVFTIKMRRMTLYYLFNVVFPCLWLSALSLLSFWLPPDTGEKITLGITVLLAFSVFMLLIAENMPATSEFVPLIGLYLTMTMGMTSLSIILTVFVLQIHHVGPHQKPVPRWIRVVVFRFLARGVCLYGDVTAGNYERDYEIVDFSDDTCTSKLMDHVDDRPNNFNGVVRKISESREGNVQSEISVERRGIDQDLRAHEYHRHYEEYLERERRYNARYEGYHTRNKDCNVWVAENKPRGSRYELDTRDITNRNRENTGRRKHKPNRQERSHFKCMSTRREAEDDYQRIVNEWRLLAVIIDRVMFYTFLLCILIATVTILVILPMNKPKV